MEGVKSIFSFVSVIWGNSSFVKWLLPCKKAPYPNTTEQKKSESQECEARTSFLLRVHMDIVLLITRRRIQRPPNPDKPEPKFCHFVQNFIGKWPNGKIWGRHKGTVGGMEGCRADKEATPSSSLIFPLYSIHSSNAVKFPCGHLCPFVWRSSSRRSPSPPVCHEVYPLAISFPLPDGFGSFTR